jgi:hypothetical protein
MADFACTSIDRIGGRSPTYRNCVGVEKAKIQVIIQYILISSRAQGFTTGLLRKAKHSSKIIPKINHYITSAVVTTTF